MGNTRTDQAARAKARQRTAPAAVRPDRVSGDDVATESERDGAGDE